MKLSSYKLALSSTPFDLFTSGYALNVFPFADESCVSRFISSNIRNAEFLLSDIWMELQVNRARGVWENYPENQPAAEDRGGLPAVYPFVLLTVSSWLKSSHLVLLSVWAVSITRQWSH